MKQIIKLAGTVVVLSFVCIAAEILSFSEIACASTSSNYESNKNIFTDAETLYNDALSNKTTQDNCRERYDSFIKIARSLTQAGYNVDMLYSRDDAKKLEQLMRDNKLSNAADTLQANIEKLGKISEMLGNPSERTVRTREIIDPKELTSQINVKEHYQFLATNLSRLLLQGVNIDQILSRSEARQIESLLKSGDLTQAAQLVQKVRDKYYNSNFGQDGDLQNQDKAALGESLISPVTAVYSVDLSSKSSEFSKFLFGVSAPPYYSDNFFPKSKDCGFNLIELNLIPADSRADNSVFFRQLKTTLDYGFEPLLWVTFSKYNNEIPIKLESLLAELNIRYPGRNFIFRIGNEPDNPGFWSQTKLEYFTVFERLAKIIKKSSESNIVGGPGFLSGCKLSGDGGKDCREINPWVSEFLRYASEHGNYLDYLSVHSYSPVSYNEFYLQNSVVSKELAKYPKLSGLFGQAKLANDEWNLMLGDFWSGGYHKEFDSLWCASANIIQWISLLDSNCWLSVRYGGPDNDSKSAFDKIRGHDFLLVNLDGKPKPAYYAFEMLNRFSSLKHVSATGGDYINTAVLAGRSTTNEISILLANFDMVNYISEFRDARLNSVYNAYLKRYSYKGNQTYNSYDLLLKNTPWKKGANLKLEVYRINNDSGIVKIQENKIKNSKELHLKGNFNTPDVLLLKLVRI